MTPIVYGHPFASFVWKPLIALYERDVKFTFRIVDPNHPENQARIAELSPTGQFPALIDGDMEIVKAMPSSNISTYPMEKLLRWCRTIVVRRLRHA